MVDLRVEVQDSALFSQSCKSAQTKVTALRFDVPFKNIFLERIKRLKIMIKTL